MNSWVSEVIAEPRNMQKTVDESIIDGVMSGLIRQNDIAEERFVPKLISNQPGSTMGDAIREELKGSESFDISVAFVSENALKSMYQAFVDHAKKSGKRNRIITSTKNYFNSPKAFKELMKLQRDANVEVLIWEHGDSGESGGCPYVICQVRLMRGCVVSCRGLGACAGVVSVRGGVVVVVWVPPGW